MRIHSWLELAERLAADVGNTKYSIKLDFITFGNENLSTEIAMTHMAGSCDEGRILNDKKFSGIETSEAKNKIIRISTTEVLKEIPFSSQQSLFLCAYVVTCHTHF